MQGHICLPLFDSGLLQGYVVEYRSAVDQGVHLPEGLYKTGEQGIQGWKVGKITLHNRTCIARLLQLLLQEASCIHGGIAVHYHLVSFLGEMEGKSPSYPSGSTCYYDNLILYHRQTIQVLLPIDNCSGIFKE